jgi:DNA-directed RNA polymerase subunit M/transcription elongation factor TFIIS
MNKKELEKELFNKTSYNHVARLYKDNRGIIDKLSIEIDELTKKVNEKAYLAYVTSIHKCVDELYRMFADKFPTSPKTAIINCKKCNHATIHLINISTDGKPTMTTCLNCGTAWQTTTKNVTEVKAVKK